MISPERLPQALKALERLIIHCKAQAYQSGDQSLGDLLNDVELLPDYLADEQDRTGELLELLQGIAQADSSCRYIVEEFERTTLPTA